MLVVQIVFPHHLTGEDIQALAGAALREPGGVQPDKGLQHQGIIPAIAARNLTQRNGTGNIGGAAKVLGTAVHQQEAAFPQFRAVVSRGRIVDDGAVGSIAGDGGKGEPPELGLSRTQLIELLADAPLGQAAGLDGLFQPHQEAHHGNAVMLVGSADMLQLHMVLHHLEMLDNVVLQQHTVHPLSLIHI